MSSPSPSKALKKRGHRPRRINLDHAIEIADVNSQFQRARSHDDAILRFRESLLGGSAFIRAERTMRQKNGYSEAPEFDLEASP